MYTDMADGTRDSKRVSIDRVESNQEKENHPTHVQTNKPSLAMQYRKKEGYQ